MAETTTTRSAPPRRVRTIRSATFWIRSGDPTDVPPYFWTSNNAEVGSQGLEKRSSDGAFRRDAAREGSCFDASPRESANHGVSDAAPGSCAVEGQHRGPAPADRDAVGSGATPRLHHLLEPGNEPRAVGHMVHVPERFGQEFEAPSEKDLLQGHGARRVPRRVRERDRGGEERG